MKVLGTKIIMVGDNNDGCAPRIHELGYDIHTGRELELMLRRHVSSFSKMIQASQWLKGKLRALQS